MEKNLNNLLIFWAYLLSVSILLAIIQTSFWPQVLIKYHLIPQLTLPIVVYFFLEKSLFSSLLFIFFISLISATFSIVIFPYLIIFYFILFLMTKIIQSIYLGDQFILFSIWLFCSDVLFKYASAGIFKYREFYFSTDLIFQILSAFMTLGVGIVFYPLLKKFLKEPVDF